ncbi:MAG: DUF945 family protein [Proteobacteria bacterium]|nr:DUF945 family protein [Pseudomonadota bacterium]
MPSRRLQLAIGLSLLLILVFGVTPAVVGIGIRDSTVTTLIALIPPETRSQLDIEETHFTSGWFRSSADMNVGYRPIGVDEFTMQVSFDIQHGPLLITRNGPRLGLAYAEIRPAFNSREITAALTQIPFELPSVRFELLAGFDRSLRIGLEISPLDYSDEAAEVVFEGLSGQLVANADQSAEFTLAMRRLQAQQNNSHFGFTLESLQFESTTQQMNDLLAPSSALLAIPAISSAGPFPFNAREISANSRVQTSAASTAQIDIYQRLRISSIESELPVASLTWTSEINEINGNLIRSYYELLANLQEQMNASQGILNTQVTDLGQQLALIAIQNSLVLNNLIEANAYAGDHSIDIRIDWQGLPEVDDIAQLDMTAVLAALNVDLVVSLDLEAIMRSPLADMVDPYVQEAYIVLENGRILVNATVRDSELRLNGELIPLDQFF